MSAISSKPTTHLEKRNHEWAVNVSEGQEQCQYARQNGSDGMLFCCFRKGHPPELGHQTLYEGDDSGLDWKPRDEIHFSKDGYLQPKFVRSKARP